MGIVVTIFMTLVLLISMPGPAERALKSFRGMIFITAFLLGAWNVFWYGAQHIEDFWGIAAVFSGVPMMIASVVGLPTKGAPIFIKCPICWLQEKIKSLPQGFHELTLVMLFGCIGIYGYTLIVLNS